MTNEKYDQDFANAMALKLRLNREARAKTIEHKPPEDDFRHEMARSIAQERGVTPERVMSYLEKFGFYPCWPIEKDIVDDQYARARDYSKLALIAR
jgi:hypothetical protein